MAVLKEKRGGCNCQRSISTHQVMELPEKKFYGTNENQVHTLSYSGYRTYGGLFDGMTNSEFNWFSLHLKTLNVPLITEGLSSQSMARVPPEILGLKMALGYACKTEARTTGGIKEPTETIVNFAPQVSVEDIDEASWETCLEHCRSWIPCFSIGVLFLVSLCCACNTGNVELSSTNFTCGSDSLEKNESCDGDLLNGITCQDLRVPGLIDTYFYRGTPRCSIDCNSFLVDECGGYCGDGVIDPEEVCDLLNNEGETCSDVEVPDQRGKYFYEGKLRCLEGCSGFDFSRCKGFCGDGVVDSSHGEECDGVDLAGLSCESVSSPGNSMYYGGNLSCNDNCTINISGCEGFCGDQELDPVEKCDTNVFFVSECTEVLSPGSSNYYSGTLGCSSSCELFVDQCQGYCGDGELDFLFGEECDGIIQDVQCNNIFSPGVGVYYRGDLRCKDSCRYDITYCNGYCGDGVIDYDVGEDCEEGLLGGKDCETILSPGGDSYYAGDLSCQPNCKFDESNCSSYCGDEVIDTPWGELCDRNSLPTTECTDIASPGTNNFYSGRVTCSNDCQLDLSDCQYYCGDFVCQRIMGETEVNCNLDCGPCGNGICELGESVNNCCEDCQLTILADLPDTPPTEEVYLALSCSRPNEWNLLSPGETTTKSIDLNDCINYTVFPKTGQCNNNNMIELCFIEYGGACSSDQCLEQCVDF